MSFLLFLSVDGITQPSTNEKLNKANKLTHNDPDSALVILSELLLETTDSLFFAKVLNSSGNAFQAKSQYDSAIAIYIQALKICDRNGYKKVGATIKNNLGSLYFIYGRYEDAEVYLNEALPIFESLRDTIWITRTVINLAGIDYVNKDFDASLQKLKLAAELAKSTKNFQSAGGVYGNIAAVYESLNVLDSALLYVEKGLELLETLDDTRSIVLSLDTKAAILTRIGNLDKAKATLEEKITLSRKIGFSQGIFNAYQALSEIEEMKGNMKKAYELLQLATHWKDTVLNQDRIAKISELETKYETEKKDSEIALLTSENKLRKNERNTFLIGGLSVLIILFLILFLLWQKQKANAVLENKNKIITESLDERELLLKEIHHRVKNNLQIISSLLNVQSKFIPDEKAKEAIREGRNRVQSMALVHQKLYQNDNLAKISVSEYLDHLSLTLFETYNIDSERIKLQTNIDQLDLSLDTTIHLGLLVNELISNALKHAFPEDNSGTISLSLKPEGEKVKLVVKDDGVGSQETESKESYGQRLIRTLARGLQGTVEVFIQGGTQVSITFPKA